MPPCRFLFRLSFVLLLWLPLAAAAQSVPVPAYDITSVKPHDPGAVGMSWRVSDDGFSVVNTGLKNVIASSWSVRGDQVIGAPAWTDNLQWDIMGK